MSLFYVVTFNLIAPLLMLLLINKIEKRVIITNNLEVFSKMYFICLFITLFLTIPFYFIDQNLKKTHTLCENKGGKYITAINKCVKKEAVDNFNQSIIKIE